MSDLHAMILDGPHAGDRLIREARQRIIIGTELYTAKDNTVKWLVKHEGVVHRGVAYVHTGKAGTPKEQARHARSPIIARVRQDVLAEWAASGKQLPPTEPRPTAEEIAEARDRLLERDGMLGAFGVTRQEPPPILRAGEQLGLL